MASDAVEAARADKAARDARANATVALRGTVASSILNRANIKESRESQIVQGQVSPSTNSNSREGRTGRVIPYTPPVINPGTVTPGPPGGGPTGGGPTGGGPTGGGTTIETQPPPPAPKPPTASELGVVKTPGRDVTKISDLVQQIPSDTIKRIAFEQLSAIELSQVLTSNTVDGINQKYSIISNLSDIRKIFNASKQLSIMNKLSPMTGVFTIDIDSKIPSRSYILNNNLNATYSYIDENGDEITVEKGYIYVDTNGDIVIEFENIKSDEIAQVQINADGTIYEVT